MAMGEVVVKSIPVGYGYNPYPEQSNLLKLETLAFKYTQDGEAIN